MKTITKTVFVADDGTEFASEKACREHEERVAREEAETSYWRVICKPDLTEGRGYYRSLYLKVVGVRYEPEAWVEDWCHRTLGRPLAFVQGVAPMRSWSVSEITKESFSEPGGVQVGDYRYEPEILVLTPGEREIGLR